MADSSTNPGSSITPDSLCLGVILSELEADLTYCDARISLIGPDPDTPYQRAQLKAFRILQRQLAAGLQEHQQQMDSLRER
ncbi:MAG: hypothetical protein H7842_00235 [Gammaproteobacteria bacterium SHHR-1]|uniref:hypothetical protein n=1 Tax=Magnetovirga frankeli TaxID=947516 RepID=UPI0012934D99|nr:hypothetical protein D5125_16360 [gamma proteobacterium SS-5]